MSYTFSRALVEAFLPENFAETPPSAPSKSTDTPQAFSSDARTTEASRRSRYGMTCEPLTADRGEELLTAFLEASRARTSALQAAGPDLTASARASGVSLPAWYAKFDRESCEWKTAQCSLLEDSALFSGTWPRSGLMLDGTCYPQPSAARINCESASGLLPTLLASNTKAVHMRSNGREPRSYLPTLCARDYRYPGKSRMERTGGKQGEVLPQAVGGPLNPDWCEWFMGFPIGWTASSALEMHRFQEWRQQHGESSEGLRNA
jgi:hypothetical protein